MKIKITAEHRTALNEFREQLASRLQEYNQATGEQGALSERREKLQAEITGLESADQISEANATKLAAKKIQLEKVEQQLAGINANVQVELSWQQGALDLLRQFTRAATAAVTPAMDAYVQEISAALRPWCADDTYGQRLARQTPAAMYFVGTYSRRFGSLSFNPVELKAAIARCEEILSGELAWSWNPNITSAGK